MTKRQETINEREEAREDLKHYLPEGSTCFLSLIRVSRSGMSRVIKCLAIDQGEIVNISSLVAKATENPFVVGFDSGVRVNGTGMDMGLALVEKLAYAVYGKPCQQDRDGKTSIKYRWL